MTYQMQINRRGKKHDVADFAAASALMNSEQERIGYQGTADRTKWPREAVIFEDGKPVAHVSQNCRVWAGTEYVAGAVPLFDPSAPRDAAAFADAEAFKDAFFHAEARGGGTEGWERLNRDETIKVVITNSDGCDLTLTGSDDYYIVGAYSNETGDSVLNDEVFDARTAAEAIAVAAKVASDFGGF